MDKAIFLALSILCLFFAGSAFPNQLSFKLKEHFTVSSRGISQSYYWDDYRRINRPDIPRVYVRGIVLGTYGSVISTELEGQGKYNQRLWSVGGGLSWSWYLDDIIGFNLFLRLTGEYWPISYNIGETGYKLWESGYIINPTIGIENYCSENIFLRFGLGLSVFKHKMSYGETKETTLILHDKTYFCPKAMLEIGTGNQWVRTFVGVSYQYWLSDNTRFYIDENGASTPVGYKLNRHYLRGYCGLQIGP